jgi:hypothetical protein
MNILHHVNHREATSLLSKEQTKCTSLLDRTTSDQKGTACTTLAASIQPRMRGERRATTIPARQNTLLVSFASEEAKGLLQPSPARYDVSHAVDRSSKPYPRLPEHHEYNQHDFPHHGSRFVRPLYPPRRPVCRRVELLLLSQPPGQPA